MADLNDFFARKDKNKPKNTKFTTVNDIDKKLKEMDLKREKAQRQQFDDEWKRFEEKKKDYTGLKIQNSTLQEDDDGNESERDGEESLCPWSTVTPSQVPEASTEVKDNLTPQETRGWKIIEAPVQEEKAPPTLRAYVPPHLRNKPAPTAKANRGKGFQSDNIENMFPSLPSAGSASVWEKKKIHEQHVPTSALKLTLENKFASLNNRSD